MKNLILFLMFIPVAFSQPRPTGNVLTEQEKVLIRQDIIERESKLLGKLDKHIKNCYSSLEKQKSLPDLVSTYTVITTAKDVGIVCTSAQIECLQNVPKELNEEGYVLLKNSHYKDFLMKEHKLKEVEAQKMIESLKKILKIPEEKKEEQPLFNKS